MSARWMMGSLLRVHGLLNTLAMELRSVNTTSLGRAAKGSGEWSHPMISNNLQTRIQESGERARAQRSSRWRWSSSGGGLFEQQASRRTKLGRCMEDVHASGDGQRTDDWGWLLCGRAAGAVRMRGCSSHIWCLQAQLECWRVRDSMRWDGRCKRDA
jgi:hypothetical protein